jgi:flagellin-like protein
MFDINTNDDARGQVGIGTLIIFIAMVLVAAVAAGVLVNTSGLLQSQAQDTGADAQAQVSNQIDVVSATGEDNGSNGSIDQLRLVVKKSPGSDPIDLNEATIQYTSDSDSMTLTQGGTSSTFDVNSVAGGVTDNVLENTDQRAEIIIDLGSPDQPGTLAEGEDAQLEIVDQSGASTIYGVNIPDTLTGTYVEV